MKNTQTIIIGVQGLAGAELVRGFLARLAEKKVGVLHASIRSGERGETVETLVGTAEDCGAVQVGEVVRGDVVTLETVDAKLEVVLAELREGFAVPPVTAAVLASPKKERGAGGGQRRARPPEGAVKEDARTGPAETLPGEPVADAPPGGGPDAEAPAPDGDEKKEEVLQEG